MLKDPRRSAAYDVARCAASADPADFSGLECRWKPLKTERGQIVTLIARTREKVGPEAYRELFRNIEKICGGPDGYCPIRKSALSLSFAPEGLKSEQKARSHGRKRVVPAFYFAKMIAENIAGKLIFRTGRKVGQLDGKRYLEDVARNADFQKFDDTLRMVMDNTPDQTRALTDYLEQEYRRGRVFYGTHIEREAIITCLIFDRADRHLHFVDGAQGGYAAAAKAMKAQIAGEPSS